MNAKSKLFISAIEEKNLEELKRLVENGMQLNWMYFPQAVLPIVLAAESGDIDFCLVIVKLGAHLHACNGLPSPLSNAVYLNFKTAVNVLIHLGCDVNESCLQQNYSKETPVKLRSWFTGSGQQFLRRPTSLALAVLQESFEIVTTLLEAGADINKHDEMKYMGMTPIHHLCENMFNSNSCNLIQVIEYFRLRPCLSPRPDLECQTKYGETPLMTAVGCKNLDAVKTLITEKVALDTENIWNRSALHYAVQGAVRGSDADHEWEEIMVALLRAGCATDFGKSKETPLDIASNDIICEILLKFGVNPLQYKGSYGTLLHLAADRGNLILMEMILMAGISVDTYSMSENTPLMYSLACLSTTKYLIQHERARLDLEDSRRDNTLNRSIRKGSTGVSAYLIIEGSPRGLRSYRFATTNPRIMELLFLTETLPLKIALSQCAYELRNESERNEMLQKWNDIVSSVHPLKHICRLVIRDALVKQSVGRGIIQVIESLPLPLFLKKFLCYRDELNRLRLSKVLNTDDDDDDSDLYDDDIGLTYRSDDDYDLIDRRHHRHRQHQRSYKQIDG